MTKSAFSPFMRNSPLFGSFTLERLYQRAFWSNSRPNVPKMTKSAFSPFMRNSPLVGSFTLKNLCPRAFLVKFKT